MVGEHVSFVAEFSLELDFRDELTDVPKGPWELIPPRRLSLEGDPFSPSGRYKHASRAFLSSYKIQNRKKDFKHHAYFVGAKQVPSVRLFSGVESL